jgi:transposase
MRYPPVGEGEIRIAVVLRRRGMTLQRIATYLGRAKSTVYWMLREKRPNMAHDLTSKPPLDPDLHR